MLPEKIDFSTVPCSWTWSGRMPGPPSRRPFRTDRRPYTHDGLIIQHVPVRKNSWTADMKAYASDRRSRRKDRHPQYVTRSEQSRRLQTSPRPIPAYGDGYRGYEDRIGVAPGARL